MSAASRIMLTAPRAERARYLVDRYADIAADRATLSHTIVRLPVHIGRKQLEEMHKRVEEGAFADLAEALIEAHYDPAYARSTRQQQARCIGRVNLERLDRVSIERAADAVANLLQSLGPAAVAPSGAALK